MNGLWIYEIEDLAIGVVQANNKDEAEKKVREAYLKHVSFFSEEYSIEIRDKEDRWFEDSPDVLEVSELS